MPGRISEFLNKPPKHLLTEVSIVIYRGQSPPRNGRRRRVLRVSSLGLERPKSEFRVQPYALNPNRAAIMVIGRIRNTLEIEGCVETREEPRAVITFPNVLWRIAQPAVSNQEIESAAREIESMHAGKPTRCK